MGMYRVYIGVYIGIYSIWGPGLSGRDSLERNHTNYAVLHRVEGLGALNP